MAGARIIAICGDSGAGKSNTSETLHALGFKPYSPTAVLRRDAEAAIDNPTRQQVQDYGKSMQDQHGNAYYARLLDQTSDLFFQDRVVIDGLRNEDELAYLRRRAVATGARLKLLALVLDGDTRFQRVTRRSRTGDPTARDQFAADDARANGGYGAFQNNRRLVEQADWRIENTGSMEDLHRKLQRLIADWTAAD